MLQFSSIPAFKHCAYLSAEKHSENVSFHFNIQISSVDKRIKLKEMLIEEMIGKESIST